MGSCRYYFSLSISDICKNLLCCNIMHILVLIVLSCTTCRFMRMMSLTWCYTVNHAFLIINNIPFFVSLFSVTKKSNFSFNDNRNIIPTMGSCLYCLSLFLLLCCSFPFSSLVLKIFRMRRGNGEVEKAAIMEKGRSGE